MLALPTLDARNPVAFLAALGMLRLAADGAEGPITLHWERNGGTWTAMCGGESIEDRDGLTAAIQRGHEARDLDAELGWERDIMKLDRADVRRLVQDRLGAEGPNSASAAVVAACVAELPTGRNGTAPYTPLRLIPRVGRARFLATARRLSESRRFTDDLRTALFGPWRYEKPINNLSWDPGATLPARAYARQAPTHFGPLAVRGIMLLAVAALPLFPLMPTARITTCRGFSDTRGRRARLIWPVWTRPARLRAVRVLLGLPALSHDTRPDERVLARHAVAARMVAPVTQFGSDAFTLGWGAPDVIAIDSAA